MENNSRRNWVQPDLAEIEKEIIFLGSDRKAYFDLVLRISLQASIIYFAIFFYNQELYLLSFALVIINGAVWNFSGWAGIGHELFHKSVFRSAKLNTILCKFFAILNWHNFYYFNYSHLMHHANTMYENDPEAPLPQGIKKREIILLITFNPMYIYRRVKIVLQNSFGILPGEFGHYLSQNKVKKQKIKNFARWVFIFQLLSLAVFVYLNLFILIFLINLAPFICKLPNRMLEIVQHYKMETSVNDFRKNTRTVKVDPFSEFLYANMNYHVEHHLFPEMPYYNMHVTRNILEKKSFLSEIKYKGYKQIFKLIYEK